jgi:L-alanine-DL-glutamate epimerase-like enolase superfamily enzyme
MKLECVTRELHSRTAFRISRPRLRELRNVYLRLEHDGITGYGEASPNAFYDETAEGVLERLASATTFIESMKIRSIADVERAWAASWQLLAPSRAAQCALDLALWDWLAKREGVSCAELVWSKAPRPVTSFCTIGLSTPDELPAKLEELHGFPQIKIKTDASASLETVHYVRERSTALLAVDANCAWKSVDLEALSRELARLEVSFIEQPLPPSCDEELGTARSCLPLMADESCISPEDIPRIAQHFDGFNIKLVKCGGITPARRMVVLGRELALKIMVGCMLESSALIAAGAVIGQRTDFADLDGAWLIANDPFAGWKFERGIQTPPNAPGLGVTPEPGLFGAAEL